MGKYADLAKQDASPAGILHECTDLNGRRIVRISTDNGKTLGIRYSYVDRRTNSVEYTNPIELAVSDAKKALERKTLGNNDGIGSLINAFRVGNDGIHCGFSNRAQSRVFAFTRQGQRPIVKDDRGKLHYGQAPVAVRLYLNAIDVGIALDVLEEQSRRKK